MRSRYFVGVGSCGHLQACSAVSVLVLWGLVSRSRAVPVDWPGTKDPLQGEDVVVQTPAGDLLGKRQDWDPRAGGNVTQVDSYLGVPYAEPPVGVFRFKPPVPAPRWTGVRNATMYGHVCPQRDDYPQLAASEDCLTLNVFVPNQAGASELWPVMVYIHGGSYRVGTGASYIGKPLAQHGVIVVTINYRLCILGFLSAKDELLPGNNGLLDQIEALKWVNKNIGSFGGDPDRVTIFGNSAGAASVGILMVSPPAKGLFQQSIVQSGSPFSFWAMHNDSVDLLKHTREVAEVLQCTQESLADLVECLRTVPVDYLAQCTSSEMPIISVSNTNFRPHVDDYVIPRSMSELYRSGHINPSRVMTGIVDREWSRHIGMMIHDLGRNKDFDTNMLDGMTRSSFEDAVRDIFERQFGWGRSVSNVVIHEYTNWSFVQDPVENREQYITFMTDFGMLAPTVELAQSLHKRNVPVYTYQFEHRSSADNHEWSSNAHLMELYYVFGAPILEYDVVFGTNKRFSEIDRIMSLYMMAVWSDFAKTGDPTSSTESRHAKWTTFEPNTTDYFKISNGHKAMSQHMNPDGVSFWNSLIPSLKLIKLETSQAVTTPPTATTPLAPLTWLLVVLCAVMAVIIFGLAMSLHKTRSPRPSRHSPVVL